MISPPLLRGSILFADPACLNRIDGSFDGRTGQFDRRIPIRCLHGNGASHWLITPLKN